jgi:hypothetical protein
MRLFPVLVLVLAPRLAAADPADALADDSSSAPRLAAGENLAYVVAPASASSVAVTTAWDGARHDGVGRAAAEVSIAHRVSIVGGAAHEASATWRPYVGAKLAIMPGLAVTVAYKAEGFVQPEGEVEATVAFGHRLGAAYVIANATYGQDIDAHQRDAEAAAAALVPIGPVVASATARARFGLGSMTELGASWDAIADVGAALPFDRYAVRAGLGISMVSAMQVAMGPVATLSLSASF